MHLIIVGRGKLAKSIIKCAIKEKISYSLWADNINNENTIILYCGSARLFKDVVSFCNTTSTPLVLLSTDVPYPKRLRFPFYFIPNSASEVIAFIKAVADFAKFSQYKRVIITESHQSTKKDVSGTAKYLAKMLGEPETDITSIRDEKTQLRIGIPKKHIEGHAYHKISFIHSTGVSTDFTISVFGRDSYAIGAISIAKQVLKSLKS